MSFCDCSYLKKKFCMLLRKYGCWLLLIVSILLPVIIVFLICGIDLIIRYFDSWSQIPRLKFMKYEYKINVVDMVAAIATVFSAGGLFFFGYWTYKNQQNNEFYSLFNTLLNEHNRLLKDLLESEDKKAKVDEINQSVLKKILFDFDDKRGCRTKEDKKCLKEAMEDLQEHLKSEIKYVVEIKPYLIVLFRLLKCIHTTQKIDDGDKSNYYALVRGLIPMEILLLILFNSQVWPEKDKGDNRLDYKDLLKDAKLFEHLPIEDKILQRLLASDLLDKFSDGHKGLLPKGYMEERFFISILNNGEFIDEKAFGDSVYVKNIRKKLQKHNNNAVPI